MKITLPFYKLLFVLEIRPPELEGLQVRLSANDHIPIFIRITNQFRKVNPKHCTIRNTENLQVYWIGYWRYSEGAGHDLVGDARDLCIRCDQIRFVILWLVLLKERKVRIKIISGKKKKIVSGMNLNTKCFDLA